MAKHTVKGLDPNRRQNRNFQYWGAKISALHKPIKYRTVIAECLLVSTSNVCTDITIGRAIGEMLNIAEKMNVRLSSEAMDNYIHRTSDQGKPFAFAQLALMFHGYLTYPPKAQDPQDCCRIWLQNTINALGLLAVAFGYEPVADCLEPYIESAS